jgi:hypothetical protein
VTCHDGFTLRDLVSYDRKHNEANGEQNRDGTDHNISWNCGVEGPTSDPAVNELRRRQQRNFLATLLLSQGVPMLLAGDELGHTQDGNNNAYCQDSTIGWLNWELSQEQRELLELGTDVRHLGARFKEPLPQAPGRLLVARPHNRGVATRTFSQRANNEFRDMNITSLGEARFPSPLRHAVSDHARIPADMYAIRLSRALSVVSQRLRKLSNSSTARTLKRIAFTTAWRL